MIPAKRTVRGGRDIGTLATRSLRRYFCGLCDQSLDRMRTSPRYCAAIYSDFKCDWHERLNPPKETT